MEGRPAGLGPRALQQCPAPIGRPRAIAEAVFHILPELLQLRLQPALRVLQFLDPAIRLAKFFLEPIDPHHEPGRLIRGAWDVSRWGRLTVKNVELRLSRRRNRETDGESRDEARAKRRRHWKYPDCLRLTHPYAEPLSILSRGAIARRGLRAVLNCRPLR